MENGLILRQINPVYKDNYELFMSSGLYDELSAEGAVITHLEVQPGPGAYRTICPNRVPFISYPYEWSFLQLKDAALLTLYIQKKALEKGMCLKDASAYNIQFIGSHAVHIDTLSFEKYEEGRPWIAYGQFCRHFLAPMAMMALRDAGTGRMQAGYIDGIPLELASHLLPLYSWLNPGLLGHIHLHAKSQAGFGSSAMPKDKNFRMGKFSLRALIDSLESAVTSLKMGRAATVWGDYYGGTNYSAASFEDKKNIISGFLEGILHNGTIWDMGANTGVFSRLASAAGAYTVAFDSDHSAVAGNYKQALAEKDGLIQPVLVDLNNPSPSLGWANRERKSLLERGPAGSVMALALVHHLAIGNNVPLWAISDFFSGISPNLIIEFVPKEDSQVQKMLYTRGDIFTEYNEDNFEKSFERNFHIDGKKKIKGSTRTVYLMRGR
jgi:ribosomal protein L11 methylase PrmA